MRLRSLTGRIARSLVVGMFGLVMCAPSSAATMLRETLIVHHVPVRGVLVDLGKRFRVSIAMPDDLRGTVTVSLREATLEQALTAVLSPMGYGFVRRNGVIVITRLARTEQISAQPQQPIVLTLTYISPDRAATVLRGLFPEASVKADRPASSLIIVGAPEDVQQIRAVVQSLDVRSPLTPVVEAIQLRSVEAETIASRLKSLFPSAIFTAVSRQSLLVRARPVDLTQIRALVASLDTPTPIASRPAGPASSTEGIKIVHAKPSDIARAVARQFPRLRTGVSGSAVVVSGQPEDVLKAKALIAQLDAPSFGARTTQVYRLRTLDAGSVGDLVARSFPSAQVVTEKELNAISVTAIVAEQQRIAEAIAQLEPPQGQLGSQQPFAQSSAVGYSSGLDFEVVSLRSAIPTQGQSGGAANDSGAQQIIQNLQQLVPNIKVSALPTPGQIVLVGDPVSLRTARAALEKIDVPAPLVVLDTEILEIDESTARNLGLLLSQPVISSTFSELLPQADPTTGQVRLINPGTITRTPLSLGLQLNLQIQKGNARVLADPRITTLSGRTATIRAGDTIGILTTVGGGPGTYATTQLQNFQTGVSLDITPIVTPGNEVTVALHPVVNSLSGIVNGVPQISTRDTQTTVHLKNNQTLIIGGLIQESLTRTQNKIPVLGDIPLLGSLFRNSQTNSTRNELVIVVTPHVIMDGEPELIRGPAALAVPTPHPLPTLPPGTQLPMQGNRTQLIQQRYPNASPAPVPERIIAPEATASPAIVPNTVSYGQIPQSNATAPSEAVRIFFASVSPAPLVEGTVVRVRVIATTNAQRATLTMGTYTAPLTESAPGVWVATFQFLNSFALGQPTGQLALTVFRADGSSAVVNLQLPVGVLDK